VVVFIFYKCELKCPQGAASLDAPTLLDLADFRFSELQIFSTLSQILAVEHAGEMGGKAAQPCSGVRMPQSSQACVLTSMMNA